MRRAPWQPGPALTWANLAAGAAAIMLAVASALSVAGCGGSPAPACMVTPTTFPPGSLVPTGGQLTARVGAVLYVALVEPEIDLSAGHPSGFPWFPPSISNDRILAQVQLCDRDPTTLPVSVTAFRAVSPGRAELSAPITAAWRGLASGPRPDRSTIVVIGRRP